MSPSTAHVLDAVITEQLFMAGMRLNEVSRMVAHYSARATAEHVAVARDPQAQSQPECGGQHSFGRSSEIGLIRVSENHLAKNPHSPQSKKQIDDQPAELI